MTLFMPGEFTPSENKCDGTAPAIPQPSVVVVLLTILLTVGFHSVNSQTTVDLVKKPSVQWKFRIGQPIFSSPVVSEGTVFFGGLDSTVYALDIQTGAQKWKLRTNGEIRSTLVIHNKHLFLAGGNGVLSCIDKDTGKPVWRTVFDPTALYLGERRYDFADYYHSTPVISGNTLFLGASNGLMQAFNTTNGELLWSFKAGDIIHNTAVVMKERLYFGCYDGYLYALHVNDGTLVWKFKSLGQYYFPKGEFNGSPAAAGNSLIIGGRDYNTYSVDASKGNAHWNKVFRAWATSYTVRDTIVYVGTSDDRLVLALDARTGQELWKTNVKFNVFAGCALSPTTIYVGTIWGRLLALDSKTGTVRWTFETEGFIQNHDRYFTKDDNFRDDIGRLLKSPVDWIGAEYKMGGIWATPLMAGDRLIIATADGTVYCLK